MPPLRHERVDRSPWWRAGVAAAVLAAYPAVIVASVGRRGRRVSARASGPALRARPCWSPASSGARLAIPSAVLRALCVVASLGGGSSDADPDWLRERSRSHKVPVLCYAGLYVRVDSPRFEG